MSGAEHVNPRRETMNVEHIDNARRRVSRPITIAAMALAALAVFAGPATAAERPNVMIIMSDDQRDDQMKVMERTRQIFDAGGTKFKNGYVTTPLCCPSRSSILTGQYVHNHGVFGNRGQDFFPHQTSIQRELSRAGYTNGVFGKFLNGWPKRLKPPHFDIAKLGYGDNPRLADRRTGVNVRKFLERQERDDDAPWFTVYSGRAPHTPLVPLGKNRRAKVPKFKPRPSYLERNLTDKSATVRRKAFEQRELVRKVNPRKRWRQQERTLLGLDEQIDKTVSKMKQLGESRDTLLFYLSDNGYLLGEHRLVKKGAPYRESVEVPFYMRWPGEVDAGPNDDRLAANIDLAPTIYDAAGITPSYTTDGHSLLGGYRRDFALAEHRFGPWNWAQVFNEDSRYIETYERGTRGNVTDREFYDLVEDPFELGNLFATETGTGSDPRVIEADARLQAARNCSGASCP